MNAVFLITHKEIARAHLAAAAFVLGSPPDAVDFLEMGESETPDNCESQARQKIQKLLENADGVLLLTDLIGASPANLVARLLSQNVENTKIAESAKNAESAESAKNAESAESAEKIIAVSGLNLAMLLRALNYRNLPLKELAEKAKEGGVASIMILKGEPRVAP